jgi:hypothetical protein
MKGNYVMMILALYGLGVANAVVFGSELRRFASEVTTISSTAHMERFKQVVARQMYAALAQIGFLGAPVVVFFAGVVRKVMGPGDVLLIIIPSAIILLLAQAYKKVETAVRELPVADEQLRRQRDHIVDTWMKKPFPDW